MKQGTWERWDTLRSIQVWWTSKHPAGLAQLDFEDVGRISSASRMKIRRKEGGHGLCGNDRGISHKVTRKDPSEPPEEYMLE